MSHSPLPRLSCRIFVRHQPEGNAELCSERSCEFDRDATELAIRPARDENRVGSNECRSQVARWRHTRGVESALGLRRDGVPERRCGHHGASKSAQACLDFVSPTFPRPIKLVGAAEISILKRQNRT